MGILGNLTPFLCSQVRDELLYTSSFHFGKIGQQHTADSHRLGKAVIEESTGISVVLNV